MGKLHVKRGDTVMIISGDDKGKKGKVLEVSIKEEKVIVEGCNIVTKHVKPRKQGQVGGIVKAEGAIRACKVQLIDPKSGKPTRVGTKIVDGKKERVSKSSGERV